MKSPEKTKAKFYIPQNKTLAHSKKEKPHPRRDETPINMI